MGSPVLGAARLTAYALWTLLCMPVQMVALATGSRLKSRVPMVYHRVCLALLGIQLVVRGGQAARRPALFICNHVSYLDIEVLGALIEGSFVAKSEVAGWPGFGFLAKLQRTVFIQRKARSQVGRQNDELRERLNGGDSLILFAEGTSSDGSRVLPFKSALFAVAEQKIDGRPLTVQPVSLAATRLDGIPLGRWLRPFYAWYGDMDLAPHLWDMVKLGRLTVEVEFHPPVALDQFGSRKLLADHCQQQIADGLNRALTGRG